MITKEIPEDFVVREVLDLKIEPGPYHYYRVTKKNWNTLDLVQHLRQRLKTDVGYAGNKDRNAVTTQYISVFQKKIGFSLKDVTFEYLGTGKERVYLGKLSGNEFVIAIRDLEKKLPPRKEVINYYGGQRFSSQNATIGKFLVTKKFQEACEALGLVVERNDYVGALKKLGAERLRFYVQAYESLLWNRLAAKSKKKVVLILGYLTEGKDYDAIMKEEGITKKDFVVRAIPEVSAEGGERDRIIPVKKFRTISFRNDELHPGKKKQVVSFFLPRGSYATVVIENMINL